MIERMLFVAACGVLAVVAVPKFETLIGFMVAWGLVLGIELTKQWRNERKEKA